MALGWGKESGLVPGTAEPCLAMVPTVTKVSTLEWQPRTLSEILPSGLVPTELCRPAHLMLDVGLKGPQLLKATQAVSGWGLQVREQGLKQCAGVLLSFLRCLPFGVLLLYLPLFSSSSHWQSGIL